MKKTIIHVQPTDGGWEVVWIREPENKPLASFLRIDGPTQADAITYARDYALSHQPSQVRVQGRNGKFRLEWSYRVDSKGAKG